MSEPCPLRLAAETLSAWQARLLSAGEQARLDDHVRQCSACQHILNQFDRIAQALRTPPPMPTQDAVWQGVRHTLDISRLRGQHTMLAANKTVQLGALASAAVLVAIFALVFVLLPQSKRPSTPLTPTATLPLATTATDQPTQPPPTPKPIYTQAGCPPLATSPTTRIGGIVITDPELISLAYPGITLAGAPTGTKPVQVVQASSPKFGNALAQIPDDDRGYYVTFCNTGKTAHTLSAVGLKIVTFAAAPGPLNIWIACDAAFNAHTRNGGSLGCGGSVGGTDEVHLSWPNGGGAGRISSVTTIPTVTLAPNTNYTIAIGADVLPQPGTYTFAAGVKVDGQIVYATAPSAALITGPVAHTWSGAACLSPSAWQSQIPLTSTDQYYVCPISS